MIPWAANPEAKGPRMEHNTLLSNLIMTEGELNNLFTGVGAILAFLFAAFLGLIAAVAAEDGLDRIQQKTTPHHTPMDPRRRTRTSRTRH